MTTDKKPEPGAHEPDRQNGQGRHAGVEHEPEDFDALNPAKMENRTKADRPKP
ncbi:hypothetical protein [Paracoccus hibiscisoli]|uniref:hypothetical protein n=1 Tax=Paracoccus hibiscisoli TaxID=2023261 RepID=UPI00145CB76B|nr:hypothetical protein [Paracoccus hibiscisoli]